MNPTAASHPRFVCRITRTWCALTGAQDTPHVAACADCQEYFRTADALDRSLRRAAVESAPELSSGFEPQILRAVRDARAQPESASAGASRRGLLWAAGFAVPAFAAAIVMMMAPGRVTPPSSGSAAAPDAKAEAAAMADTVQSLSSQLIETVLPSTGEFVANNPLQQEFDSIYADARSALGFLALNFLPPAPERGTPRSG